MKRTAEDRVRWEKDIKPTEYSQKTPEIFGSALVCFTTEF